MLRIYVNSPIVDLNSTFSGVITYCIGVFQYNEFLLKTKSFSCLTHQTSTSFWLIIIFVPIEINSTASELFELVWGVKESDSHIVWKHKNVPQDVIVVVIPDVFVGKWNHSFPVFDVNYFKTFLFQISNR